MLANWPTLHFGVYLLVHLFYDYLLIQCLIRLIFGILMHISGTEGVLL